MGTIDKDMYLVRTAYSKDGDGQPIWSYEMGAGVYSGFPKLYTLVGAKGVAKKRNKRNYWPGKTQIVPVLLNTGEPIEILHG